MKKHLNIILGFLAILFMVSCEEVQMEPLFKDSTPPGKIASPQVENTAGGAIISYTIPNDDDLLYVKAIYTLSNGQSFESRSSFYDNKIMIEGYGDTNEHQVKLIAVDLSENESEEVVVSITPEIAPVHAVSNTLEMLPDFGGVQFNWINESNSPLSFIVLAQDSSGTLKPVETSYSAMTYGRYTLRGFSPEEKIFGMVVRDRWDNYSDTLKLPLKPIFEQKLDKSKYQGIILDDDTNMSAWGLRYEDAFDDDIYTFNHSYAGDGWPQKWTVDLGVIARLSRVIVHQRIDGYVYGHGNPRLFEIWGIKETPAQDGSWDGWVKLRDCVAIKPSQEGGTAAEDEEHVLAGDEFGFTLQDPEVRYIRIVVNETWGNTGFIHTGEVTFYGQVVE